MTNISNKNELRQLIARYLRGQASEEEINFLQQYYDHFEDRADGLTELSEVEREHLKSEMLGAIDKKIRYVPQLNRRKTWLRYAAAVTLLLVAGIAALWWFPFEVKVDINQRTLPEQTTKTVLYSFRAEEEAVHHYLPDGSYVLLEPGSEISYTPYFTEAERMVELNGVAFFDIQHEKGRPFVVLANGVSTRVLGTAFKISSVESNHEFSISVTCGMVEVSDSYQQLAVLEKNDQMVLDMTTNAITKTRLEEDQIAQLEPAVYLMDNITVEEALDVISKRWDCEFEVLNKDLYRCEFTTSFLPSDNLKEIMTVISAVIGAKYQIEGRLVTLEGAGCDE